MSPRRKKRRPVGRPRRTTPARRVGLWLDALTASAMPRVAARAGFRSVNAWVSSLIENAILIQEAAAR